MPPPLSRGRETLHRQVRQRSRGFKERQRHRGRTNEQTIRSRWSKSILFGGGVRFGGRRWCALVSVGGGAGLEERDRFSNKVEDQEHGTEVVHIFVRRLSLPQWGASVRMQRHSGWIYVWHTHTHSHPPPYTNSNHEHICRHSPCSTPTAPLRAGRLYPPTRDPPPPPPNPPRCLPHSTTRPSVSPGCSSDLRITTLIFIHV